MASFGRNSCGCLAPPGERTIGADAERDSGLTSADSVEPNRGGDDHWPAICLHRDEPGLRFAAMASWQLALRWAGTKSTQLPVYQQFLVESMSLWQSRKNCRNRAAAK